MLLTEQLSTVAREFCAVRGLSLARVSTLVFNDGKKLEAVAEGRVDLSTGKFEAGMQWFSDNAPEGFVWPEGIARPEPTPVAEGADAPK